jgi:hypothetical protein
MDARQGHLRQNKKFVQLKGVSPSFLVNNLDYFLIKIPMNALVFSIFRILFFLLSRFKVSVAFRSYSMFGYLFLMVLEGNIIYFSYLFVSDIASLASADYAHSYLNSLTLLLFFVFVLFLVSNGVMCFAFY